MHRFRNMVRVTAKGRDAFFASMGTCAKLYAEIMDPMGDDPWMLKDFVRSEVAYARLIREGGRNFPRIP